MYLRAEKYFSGYDFRGNEEVEKYRELVKLTGLEQEADPETPSATVSVTVAYWRKANQIHEWFVENVQGGEDECNPHHVSREQLQELRDLCSSLLKKKDRDAAAVGLAPISGFFFGSTEIDEWYWKELENTVEQLARVLKAPEDVSFIYQSSW
jgi:hypothetical protein